MRYRAREKCGIFWTNTSVLNAEEKSRLLKTYLVLAEVLRGAGVQFFLRAGSLIGAHRHHGLIPWDDDIDVAIDVRDWELVRETLSCVKGYVLQVNPNMHWVFRTSNSRYPFVDIFFYTGNEKYIWAITHYTRRTMVLERSLVFPLTSGQFESIEVPIPKEADTILRNLYDFDYCVSRSSDHKTGLSFPEILSVHCSSLSYMYKLFNIKSS
ncbi:hypothetical protein Btru_019737 [Bulinus truncatus]|nr:hypothetical protein Btru_019737 [Bulinus truncatus]